MDYLTEYKFIREALEGSGGFAPKTATHLIKYPRELDDKYEARCELAWYENFILPACVRFAGHLMSAAQSRTMEHETYAVMADDCDGRGNALPVFWEQFVTLAKAFGVMLLLVDGPAGQSVTLEDQLRHRDVPRLRMITPDRIEKYTLGDDGKFESVSFAGRTADDEGGTSAIWTYTRTGWEAVRGDKVISSGAYSLGECPVLIFSESGTFPSLGAFSQIAYLSRRLYNMQSEFDEILRAQTFSVLTYQVPPDMKEAFSQAQDDDTPTILSSSNMLIHYGDSPAFIAPPDGPAQTYLDAMASIRERINEIGLKVSAPDAQESGLAMQYRFQALNSELASFAGRMADLERRMWDLARRWLKLTVVQQANWPTRFALADVVAEMDILQQMQAAAMPPAVISAQMRRVVDVQFSGDDPASIDELRAAIDGDAHERQPQGGAA